jgi:hypothetical protein
LLPLTFFVASALSPPTSISMSLTTLYRQYHSLYPPYALQLPSDIALASSQDYLVHNLLHTSFPLPESGYRRKFWRKVLGALEAGVEGREVCMMLLS